MDEADEEMQLAQRRLAGMVDHLRILAADVDTQYGWLHPCGWTRDEPYVHVQERQACVPVDELYLSFDDDWPMLRSDLAPLLTPAIEVAFDRLLAHFKQMEKAAWVNELETLDRPEWADVRRLAAAAIETVEQAQRP